MEIYFENIPYIGDLALEHIFYDYGEPVLFVCRGTNNKRYLCSCCKLSERWILSQVSEEELIQLIDDSISIRSLFEPRVQSPFMLSWDGVSLSAKFDNIMPELLPDAKPLELPKKETDEYREFLVDQLSSKENPKNIIVHHSEILDPSIYMNIQMNTSNFISTFSMHYALNNDEILRNITDSLQVFREITSSLKLEGFDSEVKIANQSDSPSENAAITTSKRDEPAQHDVLVETTFCLAA